jgi:hypothetical protein
MSPMLSQLLMGFLFVTIGFIAGAAVSYWISDRDKGDVHEGEIPRYKEATMPVDQAYEEVFRIYRDKTSGRILIKVEETMAPTRVDLNKSQLTLVEKVVREEMDWIGIELPKIAVQQPQSMIEKHLKPEPMAETANQEPMKILQRPVKKALENAPAAASDTRSFVEQIDEILQEMLEMTPMKDKQISLEEDPHDGVIAWIGSKRYVGIDAIDDPDVQKLIKIAVAKWEKTMEKSKSR